VIFILDNYDSFTYNLVDYFYRAGTETVVARNDEISLSEIDALQPKGIILSPGPEVPNSSGILTEVVAHFSGVIPILGICLGHQAIGEYLGLSLIKAPKPVHGKVSCCTHYGHWLFSGIPAKYEVMRYHSLVLQEKPMKDLSIISYTKDDLLLMALHHERLQLMGLQYHPESVLTPNGIQILRNWLNHYGLLTT